MMIEAFVLPYLDRSAGVVFWEPRRTPPLPASRATSAEAQPDGSGGAGAARASGRRAAQVDELTVYAPGALSPGELVGLHCGYVASLGRALREESRSPAGEWVLRWWWLAGLLAALLLAARALEFGPGHAWLALAAALTALPIGTGALAWPLGRRRAAAARRLARRAALLVPGPGTDPRSEERLTGLWRLARQLQGPPVQQLRELESYCREHAWRQAAQFYAQQREHLAEETRPGWRLRLAAWLRRLTSRTAHYTLVEMRAW
ncbi:MAG TPA: hypothetical protein VHS99_10100 [Chloroflexota bacterium]|jgi:hypothetical protein|nr:hypothetical protein [Chloroflexota bacterium]